MFRNLTTVVVLLVLVCISFGATAQDFEIYKGDTINLTDKQGRKQGKWIIFNSEQSRIIEQGYYEDNRKQGLWKKYYANGNLQSEITYQNGSPKGKTKIYYRNGNLSEEGYWEDDHWRGEYRFYHKNGQEAYIWHYNEDGKRTGTQKYFYADGSLKVEGTWDDGKKDGVIKKYYDNGTLKSQIAYNKGQIKEGSRKKYNKKKANRQVSSQIPERKKLDKEQAKEFKDTGKNQIYNKNRQLVEEGMYRHGELVNGKKYRYDHNGEKVQTIIIVNGRVNKIINH